MTLWGSHVPLLTPGDCDGRSSRRAECGCPLVVSRGGCARAAGEGDRACTPRAAACRCAHSEGLAQRSCGKAVMGQGVLPPRRSCLPCAEGLRSFSSHPLHRMRGWCAHLGETKWLSLSGALLPPVEGEQAAACTRRWGAVIAAPVVPPLA
ncbi:hypothetical protein HJG60_010431 [Phyllostomus discolor]|uniref:Uncharacterized protein n=1 Tax=Phyllostomus discolor TaxID=89673 RepID=A0A834EB66_9CHIR|nr:hypothetical protein HJG60_010431 [Phyllostomus discolor]